MNQDQFYAVRQARAWLKEKPLFLDTETTGFSVHDVVINLALINSNGQALIDTLIRPTVPISDKAAAIHGIKNSDIQASTPSFNEILPKLTRLTKDRLILIYNADFDLRLLRQSAEKYGGKTLPYIYNVACAMRLYAQFYGEKQTQQNAARQLSLELPANLHRAAADAKLCREIVMAMAATPLPEEKR